MLGCAKLAGIKDSERIENGMNAKWKWEVVLLRQQL